MTAAPRIAVLATMDTKSAEAEFLRTELGALGCRVRLVDIGLSGEGYALTPDDVPCEEVAHLAGREVTDLHDHERRDRAMTVMSAGARRLLQSWLGSGQLDGVLAVGGNQGTAVATGAMRELPFGLPKYLVSTVASNVRGLAGDKDIVVAFSVGDLLGGPNVVTGTVLRQAAAAVAGMARSAGRPLSERPRPLVAVTAFGNTHQAVTTAITRLAAAGVRTVPFHASGASGSAMERFVDEGLFDGVLDLTTHELIAELFPHDLYAPVRPGRLTAAGRRGLPQVVVPGGLDYFCFAGAQTVPPPLRARAIHHHNANNTNVRASGAELVEVAGAMAERLNAATGPVVVMIPTLGWSHIGSADGALHDPDADRRFVEELCRLVDTTVDVREMPATVNDEAFALEVADTMLAMLGVTSPQANVANTC